VRAPAVAKILKDRRGPYWIKVPCRRWDKFAIVGWANKNGKFDGIYLCKTEDGALVYVGRLERDPSEKDKREMLKRLALNVHKQPMNAAPSAFRGQPRFKGFRDDLT
jgi:ATP-dependent DNA ligase